MASLAARELDRRQDRRVCIIGAGPCGLTTVKNLLDAGLKEIVCYDDGIAIGGNWVFDEQSRRGCVYDATHLISSKRLSEFEDYPMPGEYPDYPSHRLVRAYFENYAAQFGLMRFIHLESRVDAANLLGNGKWSVVVSDPKGTREETFDDLIVCSGHHRDPFVPDVAGHFSGQTLHARDFKRAAPFQGQRVLVVGGGNSACDIAVDIGRVASHTCLSMRRGYHFVPKVMLGRPSDVLYHRIRRLGLPKSWTRRLAGAWVRFSVGPPEKYGLQTPAGRLFEMHPTLSSDILSALRDGRVYARTGIERLDGAEVRFHDGRSESFDTIIWATGYRDGFPFLNTSVVDWKPGEQPPLLLRMMHRRIPSLFFVGLFQPIGCIWRLADYQARIAALQITGRLQRPIDIDARIFDQMSSPHWRFDSAPRHALEVDYHDFRAELLSELSATAERGTATHDAALA
ncbi:MAG: NAD(P)-binding domain-containing protein [Bradyrhizobium sp.]|jgi:cation diffusion facilitator CzcD-associated flavoprotein CzcO